MFVFGDILVRNGDEVGALVIAWQRAAKAKLFQAVPERKHGLLTWPKPSKQSRPKREFHGPHGQH